MDLTQLKIAIKNLSAPIVGSGIELSFAQENKSRLK